MKILLIEDEPLVAKDLQSHLSKLIADAVVVGPLTSVMASIKWFNENELPDLILSDIRLSDGSSFEIFEKLNINCPIIFTTAYDEYAIRAFKLNSIDYLLKPVDVEELDSALKKYKSLSSQPALADQLKSFLGSLGKEQKKYKERFLTLQRNTLVPVLADDVVFFHKEELIFVHSKDNEKMISEHQTLDEIENLIDPEKFFRVNRQYIVHIQGVERVKTTHKGLTVQLKAPFNREIDISREKAVAFKNWLDK